MNSTAIGKGGARIIVLTAAATLLLGCADRREADLDACKAEGMIAKVSQPTVHARACMSGKGYEFRNDDLCLGAYSGDLALWSCFNQRSWIRSLWKKLG